MNDREPDFLWGGRPVYRCSVCGPRFERVEGLASVLRHEAEAHAPATPVARQSSILGTDGQPIVVLEAGGERT